MIIRTPRCPALGAVSIFCSRSSTPPGRPRPPLPPLFEPANLESGRPSWARRPLLGGLHPAGSIIATSAASIIRCCSSASWRWSSGGSLADGQGRRRHKRPARWPQPATRRLRGAILVSTVFWFGYTEMFAPGRALAFSASSRRPRGGRGRLAAGPVSAQRRSHRARHGVFAPLVLAALAGLFTASSIWNGSVRVQGASGPSITRPMSWPTDRSHRESSSATRADGDSASAPATSWPVPTRTTPRTL